jgi:hypothetical protein
LPSINAAVIPRSFLVGEFFGSLRRHNPPVELFSYLTIQGHLHYTDFFDNDTIQVVIEYLVFA